MRNYQRVLRTALLASASSLICSAAALAQQSAAANDGLEEIVVTAEKRSEKLQQTPISISAFSAEQLDLKNITQVKDLSAIAPNISVQPGTNNPTAALISIRGIPTPGDETQGFDTPIGTYIDGVYLARSSAASFEMAEIAQVEVLRGPQGTLFGRNTTGGAVNFITKLPSDERSVSLRAGYGDFNAWESRVIINTGTIADKLRISGSYLHKQRQGTFDNLLEAKPSRDPGAYKNDGFRFALTFDATDKLKITNIFDHTKVSAVPAPFQLAAVGDGTFRPNVTIGGFTYAQTQPANVAGYLAESTAVEPQCSKLVQHDPVENKICLAGQGITTDKIWGDMFRVEGDLNFATVRSTTAFRGWRDNTGFGKLDGLGTIKGPLFSNASLFNGMPAGLLGFVLPAAAVPFVAGAAVPTTTQCLFCASNLRKQDQVSEEIELVSHNGGKFEWVIGGFFFHEHGSEFNTQSFGFVLDTNASVFNAATFGALGPLFAAANPARYRLFSTPVSILAYRAYGTSKAIYAQGTYRPAGPDGALGITAGVRYTWDDKQVVRTQNGATPFTTAADLAVNNQKASFNKPTGNVTVDYRIADDINSFLRVARGYRSGGFNVRQTTSSTSTPPIALLPFKPETLWAYEGGVKTEFFNKLRVNASVFYNVYSNQLSTIPIPGGATFGTATLNAGKTEYTGFEVESVYKLTHDISVDGSFGYTHPKVKAFPGTDINGVTHLSPGLASVITSPGASPHYTGNIGVNYTLPLKGEMTLVSRIGWSYVSSQQGFPNPLTAPFKQQTQFESRGLIDAQVRLEGINVGVSQMKDFGINFWVKNLADKRYVARSVDFGALGFGTVNYGDPRTFGANIDLKF